MKSFEQFNEQSVELDEFLYEEGLHAWFNNSKSKDGKKGWVDVVTGDSCASDKPGEGVPKCVSSDKRASMSKAERKASKAKKRREDPGQQSKSGAAKPTHVKTDVKEACWDTHKKVGMKKKGGKMVPDCRPKSEEVIHEDDMKGMTVKSGHKRSVDQGAGLTKKGAAAYRRKNPGSKLGTAVTTPPSKLDPDSKSAKRRKSFCARSRGWDGERGKAARARWNC
jgi:hypothetical protein